MKHNWIITPEPPDGTKMDFGASSLHSIISKKHRIIGMLNIMFNQEIAKDIQFMLYVMIAFDPKTGLYYCKDYSKQISIDLNLVARIYLKREVGFEIVTDNIGKKHWKKILMQVGAEAI
jgi:hypothetical protein